MRRVFENYDAILFDCDGVLWSGGTVFDFAGPVLRELHEAGVLLRFVTNNSTKSRKTYVERLRQLGATFVEESHVVSSATAVARYLQRTEGVLREGAGVYVVGEAGLCDELRLAGVHVIGGPEHAACATEEDALRDVEGRDVCAVVHGFDRALSYPKVTAAHRCLSRADCAFIATNADRVFPASTGLQPGSGAMLAMLESASARCAVVVGKPALDMMHATLETLPPSTPRSKVLMVGDNLETDILLGINATTHTALVLTGVSSKDSPLSLSINPTYVLQNISELLSVSK